MRVNGRLTPEGCGGDFTGELFSDNRGIRIDHTAMPAFWVEALFEPKDIDKLATQKVFIMEKHVDGEGSKIIGVYRRLDTARRVAWQQSRPSYAEKNSWAAINDLTVSLRLECSDISITVREFDIT